MLIFATSDKGGTGRSVTAANIVYRRALQGSSVGYVDFDFGSPTAGMIFQIDGAQRGVPQGIHSYLLGDAAGPARFDVWSTSDRASLRGRPDGAGDLAFYPGDEGGGEFVGDGEVVARAADLLRQLDEEFHLTVVDLSAGRSHASEIVLAAARRPELSGARVRWLVFHRWTRQHIIAAAGLVEGARGILDVGQRFGHDPAELKRSIRFVRTAVVDPTSPELSGLRAQQNAWLREFNLSLQRLASDLGIGRAMLLGSVPLDPILQWREQLITDHDVISRQIANRETVDAFELIAKQIDDEESWIGL